MPEGVYQLRSKTRDKPRAYGEGRRLRHGGPAVT